MTEYTNEVLGDELMVGGEYIVAHVNNPELRFRGIFIRDDNFDCFEDFYEEMTEEAKLIYKIFDKDKYEVPRLKFDIIETRGDINQLIISNRQLRGDWIFRKNYWCFFEISVPRPFKRGGGEEEN